MRRIHHAAVVAATLAIGFARPAPGDDFRIETKVYAGKGKEPASRNTTLFRAGFVYDYLSDDGQVVVFDPARGRFIVLDPPRKLKAEVKTDRVRKLVDSLHDLAARSGSAAVRFAADPRFAVDFSADGDLALTSQHIKYRLKTIPAATPEAAAQYREFSDWYARFNTMANPGSPPPFPRLAVNAELGERGLVPTEVQFATRSVTLRTEHYVSWRLLEGDHRRIAETANQLATFEEMSSAAIVPASAPAEVP